MKSWIAVFTLTVVGLGAWAQGSLRLKNCEKGPCTPRRSASLTAIPPNQHLILEFRTHPGPAILAELKGRGIRILGYVPDSGLMVSAARGADLSGLEVTWAGPLEAGDKISPALAKGVVRAYLVVFHADVDTAEARALVGADGFEIIENPDLLPGQLVVVGTDIPGLAASDSVAYIMPASADLVAGNPVMGCPGPITEAGPIAEYVEVGNGWPQDAGGGVSLQYFFQSVTPKLDESTVRGEIERAFLEWEKYANIRLSPGSQAGAVRTITLLFASGDHGDGYPFDGPGGVLAHTFYPAPPDSEPIAGDMHFDASEDWHAGSYVDLFTVALHEAGHALGLGHTSDTSAVMYPYYRFATGLTGDDIEGIQALYGAAGAQPAPTPTPTPAPTPTPTPAPTPTPTPTPPPTDTTPPSLSITSPGASIVSTPAASLQIAGTATDNVGVTAVKWSTSNGDAGNASGTSAWSATVPLLVGNTVITVRAYDAAGNSGWRSLTAVRQ